MALIECPECGREVSDSAAACPECAYPIAAGTPPLPPRAVSGSTRRPSWIAVSIIGRIAVGGIILFLSAAEQELGAGTVLVGLLVAGSAIPTWYRHRMERLSPARPDSAERGPELTAGLEDRMVELEHRHLEQMTDLEERIEFAERLLTKQREQIGPG